MAQLSGSVKSGSEGGQPARKQYLLLFRGRDDLEQFELTARPLAPIDDEDEAPDSDIRHIFRLLFQGSLADL